MDNVPWKQRWWWVGWERCVSIAGVFLLKGIWLKINLRFIYILYNLRFVYIWFYTRLWLNKGFVVFTPILGVVIQCLSCLIEIDWNHQLFIKVVVNACLWHMFHTWVVVSKWGKHPTSTTASNYGLVGNHWFFGTEDLLKKACKIDYSSNKLQ